MSLSALAQPLNGHTSAIDLLELINAHNAPSKEVPGNGLHKNKKLKQPRSKLSAIKKMYVKAKLIAAKPINYVVNQKKISAKHVLYGVAGLASFLLVIHGYNQYMLGYELIEEPHNKKEIHTVPADDFPCQIPVVQDNNELPISQNPENPEQLVKDKVESHSDQQESVNTGTPDKPDNPEQVINETPEELKNPDTSRDTQEKDQQLVSPADNSDGSDEEWSPEQKLVVLGTCIIEACLFSALFISNIK